MDNGMLKSGQANSGATTAQPQKPYVVAAFFAVVAI
jgi:hypothetical protein